jgi:hypothetical protein
LVNTIWRIKTLVVRRNVLILLGCEINKNVAWLRLVMWKVRGVKGWGKDRDRCLLCAREVKEFHLLLKCPETQRWREGF